MRASRDRFEHTAQLRPDARLNYCVVFAGSLHDIITTHTDDAGTMPYSTEAAWRPLVDAFVKGGVRSLTDLAQLDSSKVSEVAAKDVSALQNDIRVQRHAGKQEL